jgi:hypothetical protein
LELFISVGKKRNTQIIEMKKINKLWVLTFSLLALGMIVFFSFLKNEILVKDSILFALPDTDKIFNITITNANGNKTELKKLKGEWMYNGKFKARPNAMENLLDAISKIQIQYRPPNAAVPAILYSIKTEALLVEIFDKNEKLLKAYTLGGSTQDERGTYASLSGSNDLYATELPGWSGNLRFRYNLVGDDWRDKTVFSAKPSEIRELYLRYPNQPTSSFSLQKKGNDIILKEDFSQKERKVDWQKTTAYLRNFNQLTAEAFENNNPLKETIIERIPFCEILMVKDNMDSTFVRFFPVNSERELKYFAQKNSDDLMLVQDRVFGKIFTTPKVF